MLGEGVLDEALEELHGMAKRDKRTLKKDVELFVPTRDTQCEFVEGDDLDAQVGAFAQKIAAVASSVG